MSTIFFTNINISFFLSVFWFPLNHCQKCQSNQEQCSLCHSLPSICVLLCTYYGSLQCFSAYFFKSKEVGVLRPIFPDDVISYDYASRYKFYSSLAGKKISYEDCEHYLKIWNRFKMKVMKGYHELYLQCDILLIDVFEKFRKNCLKNCVMFQSLFKCGYFEMLSI